MSGKKVYLRLRVFLFVSESQRTNAVSELQELRRRFEEETAQGDDITYGLERDRTRLRQELEVSAEERAKLKAEADGLRIALEKERQQKMQLVLLLVNDRRKMAHLYTEEKRRTDELAKILREEKNKVQRISHELEEESKRSLAMETEVEKYLRQLAVQRDETKALLMGKWDGLPLAGVVHY